MATNLPTSRNLQLPVVPNVSDPAMKIWLQSVKMAIEQTHRGNFANDALIRDDLDTLTTTVGTMPVTFAALTDVDVTGVATGDVLSFDGTDWRFIAASADGLVLTTHSNTGAPSWGGAVPVGCVLTWAASTAPTSYLLCDGASYTTAAPYNLLWTAIGSAYGAADAAHFYVPNCKGRIPVGAGQGETYLNGSGTTGSTFVLAASSGMEKSVLVNSNMANLVLFNTWSGAPANVAIGTGASLAWYTTTGGVAHNNMQPYIVMNYIIKYV